MEKTISLKIIGGLAFLTFVLTVDLLLQNTSAQEQPATDATSVTTGSSTMPGVLPADIDPNSPLAQVVRLAQAGVEQNVILTYISNSSGLFNLDSDQIVYLNDIGVPNEIVTAMMQHDQQLKQMNAATVTPSVQPSSTTQAATEQPTTVTQNYFYDTLSPYGGWVDVEGYGWCWRPTVVIYNTGWQPYCDNGHWVYTDCGWCWVSGYSWGWATFHYGRWFHHPRWGWCWWPDTVWGPSWVTWRYSSDYCGWAPLPPHVVYQSGVGLVYQGITVGVGFNFNLGASAFVFVPTRDFCDPHPRHYRVEDRDVARFYDHTTVINNINFDSHHRNIVNGGIAPDRITAVSRTPIHQVAIQETAASLPRGEQFTRDNRTLIVSHPNLTDASVESLHRGVAPHPLQRVPSSPQNNFQRQPFNQNPQPVLNTPVPQAPSREIPRTTANTTGNRNTMSPPVVSPLRNPQAGTTFQSSVLNGSDNRRFLSPKLQEQQIQRGNVQSFQNRENTTVGERSFNSSSANFNPAPPVSTGRPQNNYNSPRNGGYHDSPSSSSSQSSRETVQSHVTNQSSPSAPSSSGKTGRQDQDR